MKKGNGYDAAVVVASALEKCGCTEEKFLECARRFGKTKKVTHVTHPTAVHFADWVFMKEPAVIGARMGCR